MHRFRKVKAAWEWVKEQLASDSLDAKVMQVQAAWAAQYGAGYDAGMVCDVYEASQVVAGSLTGTATFGSIAARAEAITRTELGRIQSVATQGSLRDLQQQVPDLQKQWMHSGNAGPYRRTGHIVANGQVRDVDETFQVAEIAGGEQEALLYPRDPSASPRNTINCGCVSVPFRAAWAADLEASRQEIAAA